MLNVGKILISFLLLYFVFKKIPIKQITELWKTMEFLPFIIAAALFLLSQFTSTLRLSCFFEAKGFNLTFLSNLKLYFLGMFYNFFIPGGIGGDAYKVFILNRKFKWKVKVLTSAIFHDRLNGLLAIVFLVLGLFAILEPKFRIITLIGLLVFVLITIVVVKYLFPSYRKIYGKTSLLSLVIQLLQATSFILVLFSIGIEENLFAYALLFLGSSILSLLSFAGIGTREMLFLLAAQYFHISEIEAVSASILFTFITAFFSLIGLYYQIRVLNLKTT